MDRAGRTRRTHGTADEDEAAADKQQICSSREHVGQSTGFGTPEPRSDDERLRA
jgi:hypothetical protein